MKLDKEFIHDINKVANGDGSRETKFAFLRIARAASRELSTPSITTIFNNVVCKYGRVAVAVCLATTILERKERLSPRFVQWARCVINLWTNRPHDLDVYIDDGLHPTRIEEYANSFVRLTTEDI